VYNALPHELKPEIKGMPAEMKNKPVKSPLRKGASGTLMNANNMNK